MSQENTLTAQLRQRTGKGAARALRRDAMVPATIYGSKKPPISIALPYKELSIKIHGGGFMTTVLTIDIHGESHRVLAKDYQLDPVRDFIQHVDFLRISRNARVTVEIPVLFTNEEESPGLKRGGVLNVVRHTVEVGCPAEAIPENFIADLTGLELGDSLHISAIDLPEGVVPSIADRDFTVATIAAPAGLKETLKEERNESTESASISDENTIKT